MPKTHKKYRKFHQKFPPTQNNTSKNSEFFFSITTAFIFLVTSLTYLNVDQELERIREHHLRVVLDGVRGRDHLAMKSQVNCTDYRDRTVKPNHPGSLKTYEKEFSKNPPGKENIIPAEKLLKEDWVKVNSLRKTVLENICQTIASPRKNVKNLLTSWIEKNITDEPWILINQKLKKAFCYLAEPGIDFWHKVILNLEDDEMKRLLEEIKNSESSTFSLPVDRRKRDINFDIVNVMKTSLESASNNDFIESFDSRSTFDQETMFIQQLSLEERYEIISQKSFYKKIIITRSPLERLLLLYKNDGRKRLSLPTKHSNFDDIYNKNDKLSDLEYRLVLVRFATFFD